MPWLVLFAAYLSSAPANADECSLKLADNATVTEYTSIVAQYRAAEFTEAGERLRELSDDRIERVLVYLRQNDWPDGCVISASMLHTEVGMESIVREPPERFFDPAWELTTLIRDDAERRSNQRKWLLLVAWFYQRLMFDPSVFGDRRTEVLSLGTELFRGAERYFDKAIEAFPRDPEILVAAGTLYEWSGAPNFGEKAHLAKAEKLYERACQVAPNDPIAHLRYGYALWKRGRAERSVAPLERALELSDDDDLVFRAHMALGRIHVLQGSREVAIEHFRAAVAVKPDWQVGAIALSHALHRVGEREESRELLEHALSVPWTDDNLFGWWSYEVGLSERFGPMLDNMRGAALSR